MPCALASRRKARCVQRVRVLSGVRAIPETPGLANRSGRGGKSYFRVLTWRLLAAVQRLGELFCLAGCQPFFREFFSVPFSRRGTGPARVDVHPVVQEAVIWLGTTSATSETTFGPTRQLPLPLNCHQGSGLCQRSGEGALHVVNSGKAEWESTLPLLPVAVQGAALKAPSCSLFPESDYQELEKEAGNQ